MKVFAVRGYSAAEPTPSLADRLGRQMRRAIACLAELNARVDEGRALRDRSNEACHAVDRAFWIYLR